MKHHVSWFLALVVGAAIGWSARGALSDGRAARPAAPQAQRPAPPARPTEDPRAVYRVPVDDSPVKGPADALVTIVESTDFECPFCKRAAPTLKQLEAAYGGKVRFVFKHNPLPFHARALPASIAAEEARAQGGDRKFWAMHDALFAAPGLDEAAIAAAAKETGLDVTKVKDAIGAGKHKDRIERDQKQTQAVGATGTPTFFINGRKLVGARPFADFKGIVDEELKKAEEMVRGGTPAARVYGKIMERASPSPVFLPAGSGAAAETPTAAPPPPSPSPAAPPPVQALAVKFRPDDPARGPQAAKLTIVLFSDFQCPFCARVEPSLAQLEKAFPGQIRLVWKHQPLPMHPQAVPAALAAEAARAQGKFWPFHDRLFENPRALGPETLAAAARAAGLDMKRYEKDVAARAGAARVEEDQKLAAEVGATGTPTMFFNCRQVVGALPFEQLRAIAEAELKKADQLLAGQRPDARFHERACQSNVAAAPAQPPAAAAQPAQVGQIEVRPDDPVRGNAKAPVTVVLFSDFQCPFCARVGPALDEALRTYGDKLRVVWKHQPLSFHPNALPAATAAEAAREQGKFWQMHDRLFAAQRELSPETYEKIAKDLGLDMRRFRSAVESGRPRERIQQDQALAARIGAQATPTMFVNGERVEGAVPFAMLKAVIDRKLGR